MHTARFSLLFLAALCVSVRSFTFPPPLSVTSSPTNKHSSNDCSQSGSSTSLNIYGSYGYGRGWDYDYGNLNYGTDTYRQRYNDGYSGGVNLSYNGYSQQTNVARGRGRVAPYAGYGYGGYYDDWDDYGYGGYGGYGGRSYGGRGYGGYGGYGRGYEDYYGGYGRRGGYGGYGGRGYYDDYW